MLTIFVKLSQGYLIELKKLKNIKKLKWLQHCFMENSYLFWLKKIVFLSSKIFLNVII